MASYAGMYRAAVEDIKILVDAAAGIDWITPPQTGLDRDNPPFYRWFPDGMMNTCYNAVDRHVAAGRGDQDAIIYDCPLLVARDV